MKKTMSFFISLFLVAMLIMLTVISVSASTMYTVTFNSNGGDGTMSSQSFTPGVPQSLSHNLFNKNNYNFLGWAQSSSGSVVYEDMEVISNLTGNTTLYAKWVLWGDADSNGIVAIQDSTRIRNYLSNSVTLTDEQLVAADVDRNGVVTIQDSTEIQKYLSCGYKATVNNYFDKGFPVYYSETMSTSQDNINGYLNSVRNRYRSLLGLYIIRNDATYFPSPIDSCKGTVSSSNINTLCAHADDHTDSTKYRSEFKYSHQNKRVTNILWTGHKVTAGIGNNRSYSVGRQIMMLNRPSSSNRELKFQSILMHELNHQYGADDHYHEILEDGSCRSGSICSVCGEFPRPNTCIMCTTGTDINLSTVLCGDCKADIISWMSNNLS